VFKKQKIPVGPVQTDSHVDELLSKVADLEAKNAELEGVKLAMPDPYYIRDMDYNIIYWPTAMIKLTGYSEHEAKHLKCYDIFKAAVCPPNCDCPTQGCVKSRNYLRDVAVDVYAKNGKTIHSLVSNSGIYDKDGNPIGAVEVIKDNTLVEEKMRVIENNITNISTVSSELNAFAHSIMESSEKVSSNAIETSQEIKNSSSVGTKVSTKAEQSTIILDRTKSSMAHVAEALKYFDEAVKLLKTKSTEIVEFVKIIQDIGSKTNVLAINASIEAAHAGDSGKGFKVIADGVRELSENSQKSADDIEATIKGVNDLIQSVVKSLQKSEEDFETGEKATEELVTFVEEIALALKELMYMFNEIDSAAQLTSTVVEEQHNSVKEVNVMISDLESIAIELKDNFGHIINEIKHTNM
jgi:PAS domain S-box-containing protein